MTEQEAEVLAKRLTRIWMPETDWGMQEDCWPQWVIRKGFTYSTVVAPYTLLTYSTGPISSADIIFLLRREDGKRTGYLTCLIQRAVVELVAPKASEDEFLSRQFDLEWRDTFRRGCWLSGCDIEASAHEKAEWVQGFSRKEIEAWNLKM